MIGDAMKIGNLLLGFMVFCSVLIAKNASEKSFVFISLDDIFVPLTLESPVQYDSTITTTNGSKIGIKRTKDGLVFEGHEGKIVLLETYGYSCPHCKAAIPEYNAIKNEFPNDVYIITVETYGLSNAELRQYASTQGIQYDTVAKEKSGKLLQYFNELGYPTAGVPNLLVLRRDGTVAKFYPLLADFPKAEITDLIQNLK